MSRKTLFSKGENRLKQERYYKAEMEGELDRREIVLCMCVSKRKRELMG